MGINLGIYGNSIIILSKMCLFSDNIHLACVHSECQIVSTIRNLNSNVFDKGVKSVQSIDFG